jgi:hypothetical protein
MMSLDLRLGEFVGDHPFDLPFLTLFHLGYLFQNFHQVLFFPFHRIFMFRTSFLDGIIKELSIAHETTHDEYLRP